jgi:Regulator of chromosome condensation (RCC1) repeat
LITGITGAGFVVDLALGSEQPGLGDGQPQLAGLLGIAGRRPGEPERRGQVTAGLPSPGADVGLVHPESGLDEADERGVVEHVGADEPAVHGDTIVAGVRKPSPIGSPWTNSSGRGCRARLTPVVTLVLTLAGRRQRAVRDKVTPAGCGTAIGELGDNTTTDRTKPVKVKGLSNVVAVTTGGRHACALVRNGGAKCWGANGHGQLGDGTTSESHAPVAVQGLPVDLAQIAAGGTHTCGLLTDGTVRCWGSGGDGELGNGSTSDSATPVMVTGLPSVVQIAVGGNLLGGDTTCALTSAGTVFCWGENKNGELGDGTTTNSDVPVQVTGLSAAAVAITQTAGDGCAALVTGQVECWGDNGVDELGDGVSGGMTTTPVLVSGFTTGGTSINTSNGGSTCALDLTQQAQCWGWNTDGQLGDGSTSNSDVPVPVSGL